jgi:hypothetical protein
MVRHYERSPRGERSSLACPTVTGRR